MDDRPALPDFTFWQRFIRIGLIAWIGWGMHNEILLIFWGTWNHFKNHYLFPVEATTALIDMSLGVGFLIVVYLIYIFCFAQFILPVKSLTERLEAFWRLFLFGIARGRWHGPAVFVRNGEITGSIEELENDKPGVAFIDLRSAITLDLFRGKDNEQDADLTIKPQRVHFGRKAYPARIRVAGPGLTFTKKHEKITGHVDLRIQSRGKKDVFADTRDGIRIKTGTSCTFTLGQPPEILDVYVNGNSPEQVFIIEWEKLDDGSQKINRLFSDELDQSDAQEILSFAEVNPDPANVQTNVIAAQFPFTYDPDRVEAAIYTETHLNDPNNNRSLLKAWSDWPEDVVVEEFRLLLSKQPFLNLYIPKKPEEKEGAMNAFKRELFIKVRNTGVLAYRLVKHLDGQALKIDESYQNKDLIFYPPRNLTRPKVLRDRGIKVLSAGFGELEPVDEHVHAQLLDAWISIKKREVNMKFAENNLEAARIKNHARVRAQQSMIYAFTKLLENQEYPREALAMLIYQELEAAAANPETRRLLPETTLNMITGLGQWLSPNSTNDKHSGDKPFISPNDDE
jgi:hypothetical protein